MHGLILWLSELTHYYLFRCLLAGLTRNDLTIPLDKQMKYWNLVLGWAILSVHSHFIIGPVSYDMRKEHINCKRNKCYWFFLLQFILWNSLLFVFIHSWVYIKIQIFAAEFQYHVWIIRCVASFGQFLLHIIILACLHWS